MTDAGDAGAPQQPPPDATGGTPRCLECGAQLADDQTYCLECGTPTPRAPRLNRRRAGALLAGALAVLGLGAGALAYAVVSDEGRTTVATRSVPVTDTVAVVTDDEFTIPTDTITGELPPDTEGMPLPPATDGFPVVTEQPDPDAPVVPDPDDPFDPLDPIDPDDPVDPDDPFDPLDPIDPDDPFDPVDPVDPVDPGVGGSDWPVGFSGWTAILSSTRSESEARNTAASIAGTGEEIGVLFSSDHPGLRAGYWVVFSGTFTTRAQAASHARALRPSHPGAYPREIRS